jgi:hypothetical protein
MSLQQILSYSSAIERIQQTQQQHPDTYQQFSSFKMKEENATKQGEVPDPKHAEYVSIREDKNSQPRKRKNKKKKQSLEVTKKAAGENQDHKVDIVV